MISKIQISTLLLAAAMIWGALLFLDGVAVSISWLKPLSAVSGGLIILLGIFDRWAWKLPFLYPWFTSIPNLHGTWKGQINSSWLDPHTGKNISPIDAYLVIAQTYSSIQMRLLTKESRSDLLTGHIFQEVAGSYTIAGIYRNTPSILNRANNPIHQGSILLYVQGDKKFTLDGEYWTDRQTKGMLCFTERNKMLIYDYGQASIAVFQNQIGSY